MWKTILFKDEHELLLMLPNGFGDQIKIVDHLVDCTNYQCIG